MVISNDRNKFSVSGKRIFKYYFKIITIEIPFWRNKNNVIRSVKWVIALSYIAHVLMFVDVALNISEAQTL